ncbi:Netrin receptor unc5d, partial [Cichlidogyrus casuarinus]
MLVVLLALHVLWTYRPISCDSNLFPPAPSSSDDSEDLVRPNEMHLPDVPKFLRQPEPVYYVLNKHPATFTCQANPVDHMVIVCLNEKFPVDKPDSKVAIRRTKFNDLGHVDDQYGQNWLIQMNITAKMLEAAKQLTGFGAVECHCEAWNKIHQLQRAKKVQSQRSDIREA